MINRFMSVYEVLFDASSAVPIEGASKKFISNIGKRGMANVGNKKDEILTVDRSAFHKELNRLLDYHEIDAPIFFKLVHSAFDKAVNDQNHKNLIFYHIHNPGPYAKLNFVRSMPEARWIIMVREPLQSCESG